MLGDIHLVILQGPGREEIGDQPVHVGVDRRLLQMVPGQLPIFNGSLDPILDRRPVNPIGHVIFSTEDHLYGSFGQAGNLSGFQGEIPVKAPAKTPSLTGHFQMDIPKIPSELLGDLFGGPFRGLDRTHQMDALRGNVRIEIHRLHAIVRQERGFVRPFQDHIRLGKGLFHISILPQGLKGLPVEQPGEDPVVVFRAFKRTFRLPFRHQGILALHGGPGVPGENGHLVPKPDDIHHPGDGAGRRIPHRSQFLAKGRGSQNAGDEHSLFLVIHSIERFARNDLVYIHIGDLLADNGIVFRGLQGNFFRHFQGGRFIHDIAIGKRFPFAVGNNPLADTAFRRVHAPAGSSGTDQHLPGSGPGLPEGIPPETDGLASPGDLPGVAIHIQGCLLHIDVLPGNIQFLGDNHGHGSLHPLPDFRVG